MFFKLVLKFYEYGSNFSKKILGLNVEKYLEQQKKVLKNSGITFKAYL